MTEDHSVRIEYKTADGKNYFLTPIPTFLGEELICTVFKGIQARPDVVSVIRVRLVNGKAV